jgi:hypothetical protein
MRLEGAFVPPLGAGLVCRFEEQGREIIAEGVVAWREQRSSGGAFGLMFTALDSGSVGTLRALVGLAPVEPEEMAPVEPAAGQPDAAPPERPELPELSAGTRVRLHIEGLATPMKAQVRRSSSSRVRVASNLEFFAAGRSLELEDTEHGTRRAATVDGIDVIIDPQSGVPQIVVSLKYSDLEDITPEPSVIDDEAEASDSLSAPFGAPASGKFDVANARVSSDSRASGGGGAAKRVDARSAEPGEFPPFGEHARDSAFETDEDELEPPSSEPSSKRDDAEAQALLSGRARFAALGRTALQAAAAAGATAAKVGRSTATGLGSLWRGASGRVAAARSSAPPARRVTAPPPAGSVSLEGKRLRPQIPVEKGKRAEEASAAAASATRKGSASKRTRRIAAGVAAVALLGTVGVIAASSGASTAGGNGVSAEPVAAAAATDGVIAAVPAASVPSIQKLQEPPPAASSLVANVPLFGPTPMATLEPAPLEAAPVLPPANSADRSAEAEQAPTPPVPEPVPVAKAAGIPDEVFEEPAQPDEPKPEDVKPWGRGKLNTPVVHRLRLDGPGMAIQGSVTGNGFSVIIPGRKVMESGDAILKRDKRLLRVSSKNSGTGAQVTFSFKDGVPGYRVRLRRDFVEILISASTP